MTLFVEGLTNDQRYTKVNVARESTSQQLLDQLFPEGKHTQANLWCATRRWNPNTTVEDMGLRDQDTVNIRYSGLGGMLTQMEESVSDTEEDEDMAQAVRAAAAGNQLNPNSVVTAREGQDEADDSHRFAHKKQRTQSIANHPDIRQRQQSITSYVMASPSRPAPFPTEPTSSEQTCYLAVFYNRFSCCNIIYCNSSIFHPSSYDDNRIISRSRTIIYS